MTKAITIHDSHFHFGRGRGKFLPGMRVGAGQPVYLENNIHHA
jgi:hypothetical protein